MDNREPPTTAGSVSNNEDTTSTTAGDGCIIGLCSELNCNQSTLRVKCANCGCPAHVGCLFKSYKDWSKTAPKVGIEWITEFISFNHLQYVCPDCFVQKPSKHEENYAILSNSTELTDYQENISRDIHELKTSISEIKNKLAQLTLHNNTEALLTTDNNAASKNTAISYSDALTANIKTVVKSVVIESLNEYKYDDINTCIVIYGMEESKNDKENVHRLLQSYGYEDTITRITRLGKLKTATEEGRKVCRPIRVQLNSQSDRD